MLEKKYIFFDIDGTILTAEGTVPNSTKKALKLAQKNGHEIFINTGRSRNIIPQVLEGLNFDGIVCGTGAHAEYHGKDVFRKCFSKSQVDRIVKFTMENNIPIIMSTESECVGSRADLLLYLELFSGGSVKAEEITSLDDIAEDNLLATMEPVIADDDKTNYSNKYSETTDFIFINSPYTVAEFNELIGPDINVGKASFKEPDEYSGEITLAECTKASGIDEVLSHLGAKLEDSIAVGDGFNDVEMLKHAHLSIAMGNSPDEVKEISDYVTDDIYNHGIKKALQHFSII